MACTATSALPVIFGKDSDGKPEKLVEASAINLGTVSANLFLSAGTNIATMIGTTHDHAHLQGLNDDDHSHVYLSKAKLASVAAGSGAAYIGIQDSLTYYSGTTVESALAQGYKSVLDTNTGLTPNSDLRLASQKAIKAYVDGTALLDSEVTNLAFVKSLAKGISDGNVLTANDVVADDDFLRINGTEVEGLTVAEVLTALNVAAGAEVNVKADWNASSGDAEIENKPDVAGAGIAIAMALVFG